MTLRKLAALGVVIVAMAATAIAASPAHAAAAGINACVATSPIFTNRWQQRPGAYGCAIAPLAQTGNGYYQNFVLGQMVWSPSQGGSMIVSGWRSTYLDDTGTHTRIDFQWGLSTPFTYNSWLIRLDRNNISQGQWECFSPSARCGVDNGTWGFAYLIAPGNSYQFSIEGCDYNGNHTCRQGWTIPVWLWF